MLRAVVSIAALFAAYKLGEYHAQVNSQDYVITNTTNLGGGVQAIEYLKLSPNGMVFTQDPQLATIFLFGEATRLKELLRKHIPNLNLVIETVSNNNLIQNGN